MTLPNCFKHRELFFQFALYKVKIGQFGLNSVNIWAQMPSILPTRLPTDPNKASFPNLFKQ